jgi:AcrR family transcriptional regulator
MTMASTKDRILRKAIQLFSEKGYNGISMRMIADAVEITAPALYNHFPDKQSLYQTAVAQHFLSKAEPLKPALERSAPAIDRLQDFIERLCRQMGEDEEFRRLIQWELLTDDQGRLRYLGQDLFAPLFGGLLDLLGELKPQADLQLLAILLIGMIHKPYEMKALARYLPGASPDNADPGRISSQVTEIMMSYLGEQA